MQADTLEELHAMADQLGLQPAWFQSRPGRPWHDHYDLTRSKRDHALRLGAIAVTSREAARRNREVRRPAERPETIRRVPILAGDGLRNRTRRQVMSSLDGGVREVAPGPVGPRTRCSRYVLDVGVAIRGPLLRAQAAVLPAGVIDPHQLLYWNRQAPLVCFAENQAGEVFVCGELPLESLNTETLDRFLGLLLASAARAREFALRDA